MTDLGFIIGGYAAAIAGIGGYAAWTLAKGRRLAKRVPLERQRFL